ncbi:MAG: GTP-binding protein [Acidimicrobiia bacterium]|nr:GTP-binding protein [Acidimicrobiia bacterium]MDH5236508.1 GTP-binding protein [Acidimicrobiia bacterium]
MVDAVALTVIGGYLGAGKTSVVNHLLATAHGRRLAVIVNDFGDLAIDAALLSDAAGADDIVSLPNGCVCCTLGTGLLDALTRLSRARPPVDQVMVEASGVADPAAVAAWGHTPPFVPGGIVVVVAADSIERQAGDRLIGREIHRQLTAAELLLLTKTDHLTEDRTAEVTGWLARTRPDVPIVTVAHGAVPPELVLGRRGDATDHPSAPPPHPRSADYRSTSWISSEPVDADRVRSFLEGLDPAVIRLKGWVSHADGSVDEIHVVGPTRQIRPTTRPLTGSQLVAIGLDDAIADDLWRPLEP